MQSNRKPDRRLTWKPMTQPPKKPGRYPVCHRGGVAGDAYWMDGEWTQLPSFGPTHWIEAVKLPMENDAKRFWAPEKKVWVAPPKKKGFLHRLFNR